MSSLKACWDALYPEKSNSGYLTLVTSSFPSAKVRDNMGRDVKKSVLGVSDGVRFKSAGSATETSQKIDFLALVASLDIFSNKRLAKAYQTVQAGLHLYCSQTIKTGFLARFKIRSFLFTKRATHK